MDSLRHPANQAAQFWRNRWPALHFPHQKIHQPSRCQGTMVDSRRMTSAVRQSKSLEDSARPTRVATAASSLQKRRRIDYRRGGMTILDRRGLKAASCGCYKPDWDFYDRILG
jgi:hypothetical protein